MISVQHQATIADVGKHYDELDPYYRRFWGLHVHHGLWNTGRETSDEAVRNLSDLIIETLALPRNGTVCDIGCGYGETSRIMAAELGAQVNAFTVSRSQYEVATAMTSNAKNPPSYFLRDWCENGLQSSTADGAIAIESSEHFIDRGRLFTEAFRVLKPGGRLVVAAWLSKQHPSRLESQALLEPICREGRLPSLGTASEYRLMMSAAGFQNIAFQDVSRRVKKTWAICARRLSGAVLTDAAVRKSLFSRQLANRDFALSVFRLWAAFALGTMQYGIFSAEKGRDALSPSAR